MERYRSFVLMAVLAAAILALSALAMAAPSKPDGAAIFSEHCAECHGPDGKGFSAIHTPDFTNPKWQASHTDRALLNAIEHGVKGTAMLSFEGKLSSAEMHAVLDYIRSLNPAKKSNSTKKK